MNGGKTTNQQDHIVAYWDDCIMILIIIVITRIQHSHKSVTLSLQQMCTDIIMTESTQLTVRLFIETAGFQVTDVIFFDLLFQML